MSDETDWQRQIETIIRPAVDRSLSIDAIDIGSGNLEKLPTMIRDHFGDSAARVTLIADDNTFEAAGKRLQAGFASAGFASESFVFDAEPRLKPSVANAERLLPTLERCDGTILAVGSGVINDLVKYAAHRVGKPYVCVATAASMDGYASAGSPLSDRGFKHTISCAPPRILLADMDVVTKAPAAMAGWGYGDLAGKVAAGADWIVADQLDIEPIDNFAWPLVHCHLRPWLAQADAIRQGEPHGTGALFAGLVITGLAMEFHGTSRPASGADHQIGHLWEMRDVSFQGLPVSHGSCVALGTLSVLALYDWLLQQDLSIIDVDGLVRSRPTLAEAVVQVEQAFGDSNITSKSIEEIKAKQVDANSLRQRLTTLAHEWPNLRERLRGFLMGASDMQRLLEAAGVVTDPLDVGITRRRHQRTVIEARLIRRRYTVLDLLYDVGLLDTAIEATFAETGYWGGRLPS